ncbi:MAG TPA: hypothetical protein VFY20_06250 [Gemmatimonadales bacterium]|nr:hypothetical protein [Gemmatimonadales bacterium]
MRFGGRWVRVLSVAMVLVAGQGLNADAQAPNRSNPVRPVSSVFTPLPGLASTYRVRLASQWTREGIVAPCPIQGGETVEGTLSWTGTVYEGMLRRSTRYQECAVHGQTCLVKVEGGAEVHAAGEVTSENGVWILSLRWTPARDVHVEVTGDCPEQYREGLERLYRTRTQRVAFELPPPNAFTQQELDPYPWIVRVE